MAVFLNSAVLASLSDEPTLIFPQFVNGKVKGVQNKTRIILRNNSDEQETGEIRFKDPYGTPILVPVVNGSATSTISYIIAPRGIKEIETDGTGSLKTGSLEVHSDRKVESGIEGTIIFDILGNKVSVDNSPLRGSHQIYVSQTGEENTAIAAYNPHPTLLATSEILLLDDQGNLQATGVLELQPQEQFAAFVDHNRLFADFFNQVQQKSTSPISESGFKGTIDINVRSDSMPRGTEKIAVIGLLQERSSNALIAVSTSPNTSGVVSLCNCSAEIQSEDTDVVIMKFGVTGDFKFLQENNQSIITLLGDDEPIEEFLP